MIINRAFCVELQRIMTINEAHRCYFEPAPAARRRFTFLCSDKICRERDEGGETIRTKVTGVNYDKSPKEEDYYLKPHFRSNTPHSPNCEWLKSSTTQIGGQCGGDDPNREISPKSSDVIDIFLPDTDEAAKPIGGGSDGSITETEIIEEPNIIQTKNLNVTSCLENVVDSYLFLSPDQKRSTHLKLGRAPWRSYTDCFRPIKFYNRGGTDKNSIFYGNIWGRKVGSSFSLFFYDRPEFRGKTWGVELRIEESDLTRYKHGGYVAELLTEVIKRGEPSTTCYFYGSLQPDDATTAEPLRVCVANLGNLVFKLKSKQRK